jgi:hypothetical protein
MADSAAETPDWTGPGRAPVAAAAAALLTPSETTPATATTLAANDWASEEPRGRETTRWGWAAINAAIAATVAAWWGSSGSAGTARAAPTSSATRP